MPTRPERSPYRKRNIGERPRLGAQPAMRVCLRCDQEFRSEGPWNRICPPCKRRQADSRRALMRRLAPAERDTEDDEE